MKVWAFLTIFASTAMFANAEEGGAEVSDETSLLKQSPSSGLVMAGSDGGAVMRCQYNKTKHSAESDPIEWFFENDDGSEEPLDEEFISITENGASLITVPSAEAKQGTYLCR